MDENAISARVGSAIGKAAAVTFVALLSLVPARARQWAVQQAWQGALAIQRRLNERDAA